MSSTKVLSAAALIALMAVPFLIVLNAAGNRSDVDDFFTTRAALFGILHTNASSLPAGYEHVHQLSPPKVWPPDEHIRSVVGGGKLWHADSTASYDIRLIDETAGQNADQVVMELVEHFSTRLEEVRLVPSQSGGPSMIAYPRAAHHQSWRSNDPSFIVTLTAIVDAERATAFVSRFVHERLE